VLPKLFTQTETPSPWVTAICDPSGENASADTNGHRASANTEICTEDGVRLAKGIGFTAFTKFQLTQFTRLHAHDPSYQLYLKKGIIMPSSIDTPAQSFPALAKQQYMNLTTYRKSGEAVPTPVWFVQEGTTLYVTTQSTSGKVKRIRNNGNVQVAPCTANGTITGESAEGLARLLVGAEGDHARALLDKKYGLQKKLFDLMNKVRGGEYVHIEITPM
jgi:uncharacterized protein